jgi:hypothetical protein
MRKMEKPLLIDPRRSFEFSARHPLLVRLLESLATDLYRPHRLPHLFSNLYPGEFFNPHSAPLKIHQLIHRLRQCRISRN